MPNRYPPLAGELGRAEVVVHTPRHLVSLGALSEAEVREVAAAWQVRARAAFDEGFGYVHALLNEGRDAGGSLPHTHSQLVWLHEEPPAVAAERSGEPLAAILESELRDGVRIVAESDHLVALCPYAARAPYELLVAPRAPETDTWESGLLGDALALLADLIRRLRILEPEIPLNAWLHAPSGRRGHWHFELVPRLTVPAGLELGAGVYVNPLPPEQAAEALRGA